MAGISLTRCSEAELSELVRALHRGRRVIDGHLARIATEANRREEHGTGPAADQLFGRGGDVSSDEARRQAQRGRLSADLPQTAAQMHGGHVLTENMDKVARSTRHLTTAERSRLAVLDREIATRAGALPPETFARWFDGLVRSVVDDDRPSAAERQRAASQLNLGRSRNGMWWISGRFDQERGAEIAALIKRTARHLAGSETPTDNTRAAALHHLVASGQRTEVGAAAPGQSASAQRTEVGAAAPGQSASGQRTEVGAASPSRAVPDHAPGSNASPGSGSGAGSPPSGGSRVAERRRTPPSGPARLGIGYIIDATTLIHGPHGGSVSQTWAGDDHDPRAVQRLACDADWYAVLVDQLGRPDAVGRTRRSATREQRLALRALYRCCPLDGTSFDRCEIHHVNKPVELGGATVLDNLVPVSSAWHHRIHDRGWSLTMAGDRTLTLRRPNGQLDRVVPPPQPLTRQRE